MGCWNIEGIYENFNASKMSKLEDPSFLSTLKKFDILCLQETHVSKEENLKIPSEFRSIPHCRKISGNSRYFGGVVDIDKKINLSRRETGKVY